MSDLLTGLLQESVSGIALGCIYALIALGFTLIYKATEVVNFAQGEIMMVGAYINFFFVTQFSAMAGELTGWESEIDYERQMSNVFRMRLLGATVEKVKSGSKTLKDAMNEALRDWVTNVNDTFYIIGSVAGPHPYPEMVRDFQSVIGYEAKDQIKKAEGRLPDFLIACVGGGSNAMGLFYPFLNDRKVKMIAVEAAGEGLNKKHAASIAKGQLGVLHGSKTYILQDKDGQIIEPHSISAGLDYPGVGPEHAWLKDNKRVEYVSVTDNEALDAFKLCSQIEGIIPALEPSHALAYLIKKAPRMSKNNIIIMNMCGRGDKDIFTVAKKLKINI